MKIWMKINNDNKIYIKKIGVDEWKKIKDFPAEGFLDFFLLLLALHKLFDVIKISIENI